MSDDWFIIGSIIPCIYLLSWWIDKYKITRVDDVIELLLD